MTTKISSLVFASILAIGGIGFGADANADNDRNRNDDRYEVCDNCGTVRSISRVNRRSSHNTGATVLGAVVGGVVGNQIGGGSGKKVATVAGAVAGGVIANNATRDKGRSYYRIKVRMDNGRIRSYDQSSTHGLRAGSRVEVHQGSVYREG